MSMDGSNRTSTSGTTTKEGTRTNSRGELHCYNCDETDHWAHEYPYLSSEQQQQLHINLEAGDGPEQQQEKGHQLMHVLLAQGANLLDNRAYLDKCSTVTAFKSKKYLQDVKKQANGIKINCNVGTMTTDIRGKYGSIKAWYISKGIASICSMQELEKLNRITYNSWEGHYTIHMPSGMVKFFKNEQGLPDINLDGLGQEAALMLLETAVDA
jgi:hypothetical protein